MTKARAGGLVAATDAASTNIVRRERFFFRGTISLLCKPCDNPISVDRDYFISRSDRVMRIAKPILRGAYSLLSMAQIPTMSGINCPFYENVNSPSVVDPGGSGNKIVILPLRPSQG